MYLIAVIGAEEGEHDLATQLYLSFAQRKRSVICIKNDSVMKLYQSNQYPECYLIAQCKKIERLKDITPDIIIIKHAVGWDFCALKEVSDSWIIVDSQDYEGIELAAQLKGRVISCGLKQNSTLLVSGLEGENFTFSLQRKLKNILNDEVEEQDIVVQKNEKLDEFEQGALLATLLICGMKAF